MHTGFGLQHRRACQKLILLLWDRLGTDCIKPCYEPASQTKETDKKKTRQPIV